MSLRLDPTRSTGRVQSPEQIPSPTAARVGICETPSSLSCLCCGNDSIITQVWTTISSFFSSLWTWLIGWFYCQEADLTTQQSYLRIIHLNPNHFAAYVNLGASLPANGSIQLINGTTMTTQALFLKAIDLDPNDSEAYVNLGAILTANDSIQLLNGTTMTQQALFLKAIDLAYAAARQWECSVNQWHDHDTTGPLRQSD